MGDGGGDDDEANACVCVLSVAVGCRRGGGDAGGGVVDVPPSAPGPAASSGGGEGEGVVIKGRAACWYWLALDRDSVLDLESSGLSVGMRACVSCVVCVWIEERKERMAVHGPVNAWGFGRRGVGFPFIGPNLRSDQNRGAKWTKFCLGQGLADRV